MFLLSTYWWGANQQAMPYYSRPMTLHHGRDIGAKQIEEKKEEENDKMRPECCVAKPELQPGVGIIKQELFG